MMTILLTDAMRSLVPSHYEVAEDVFREANGALELARLRGGKRELDDPAPPVAVLRGLVREPPLRRRHDLLDLAAEVADGLLDPLADRTDPPFGARRGAEV